ncbi:MAG: FAD-linked oxidase C-terminal domain-containing protein [Archaeoglobales archaeon]|nr:FAD-linked oxidase C-terminal domain-containing protein [Archaeoglobales archaeon]
MDIVQEISRIVGKENVSKDPVVLQLHSMDAIKKSGKTNLVVFPENTEQVSKIMKFCYENEIKVYPQGSSTELSGSSIPEDGLVLNLSKMNKIEDISILDGYVITQAGAKLLEIEEKLNDLGFTFPIDPGSLRAATVGGAINTGAGGMKGAKYGTIVDWVLGLEIVTADGRILNIGSKTLKCRQGYYLTKLIVGSEGTLAIVTRAILKIVPMPENMVYGVGIFRSPEDAMEAVLEIKKAKILPAVLEFLDSDLVKAGRDIVQLKEEGDMLLVGIECNFEARDRIAENLKEILRKNALDVEVAKTTKEAEERNLLGLRRAFYPLALKLASQDFGNKKHLVLIEDIAVPVSKLPRVVKDIKACAAKYGFRVLIAGHVGDGNLHPTIWTLLDDSEMMERAEKFYMDVMKIALENEGTISAEHGIGVMKKKGLEMEMSYRKSEYALELMRKIKSIFDPKNILNPGKVI